MEPKDYSTYQMNVDHNGNYIYVVNERYYGFINVETDEEKKLKHRTKIIDKILAHEKSTCIN